jgi:predicted XRE-type DNA-binding protein
MATDYKKETASRGRFAPDAAIAATRPHGGSAPFTVTGDVVSQLPLEVTSAITWYMKQHRVSRAELAKRLSVTPGRVSQVLSGDENLTLRTIGTVAEALGAHVEVTLIPADE